MKKNSVTTKKKLAWKKANAFFTKNPDAVKCSKSTLPFFTANKCSFIKDDENHVYALPETKLGEGGEAIVRQAITSNNEPCAVKILYLDPNYNDLAGERVILEKLQRLLGSTERSLEKKKSFKGRNNVNKKRYIFQKLIEGVSLWEFLNKHYLGHRHQNGICEIERLTLAYFIAKEIQYLHQNNIIHGDVKLDNFIFNKANTPHYVTAIDFNLGHILEEGEDEIQGYQTAGTQGFSAPEIKNSEDGWYTFSPAQDIYAFGYLMKSELKLPEEIYKPLLADDYLQRPNIETLVNILETKIHEHEQYSLNAELVELFKQHKLEDSPIDEINISRESPSAILNWANQQKRKAQETTSPAPTMEMLQKRVNNLHF